MNRRYSVTACFDGNKRVVSGSEDGSIYIWDINNSKSVVQKLQGHNGEWGEKVRKSEARGDAGFQSRALENAPKRTQHIPVTLVSSLSRLFRGFRNVCMYGHTYNMDQPGKVANPARGQLNRENGYFPVRVRA